MKTYFLQEISRRYRKLQELVITIKQASQHNTAEIFGTTIPNEYRSL